MPNISSEDRFRALNVCRELGGLWSEIEECDDLIVSPISTGLMNQIIHCRLKPSKADTNREECDSVVIRYAVENHYNNRFDHSVISMINLVLSQHKLTPKVVNIFSNGIISQFIDCRPFNYEDDRNLFMSRLLAQKLAKLHSIRIPLPKDMTSKWLAFVVDNWYSKSLRQSMANGFLREEIVRYNKQTFLRLSFTEELDWIRRIVVLMGSPVVFSHCDFNRGNILVRKDSQNNNIDIFVIDFDFSCNTYRGFDFGRYFSSWGDKEHPIFGSKDFPKDHEMIPFIDSYIEENIKIYGKKYSEIETNCREFLIRETKVFALFEYLVDVLYCLYMSDRERNKIEEHLKNGETRFKCYENLKLKVLKEYSELFEK